MTDKRTIEIDVNDESAVEKALNMAKMGLVDIKATAVVKQADGSIKYDNPERAGNFKEENLDDS